MDSLLSLMKANVVASALIVLVTLKVLHTLWNRRDHYYMSWKMSGPLALPLIGNLHNISVDPVELIKVGLNLSERYGYLYRVWVGPILTVVVSNPEDLQVITQHSNSFDKPFTYSFTEDWIGDGLVVSSRDLWKVRRKMMAQAFTPSMLDSYMSTIHRQSDVFMSEMKEHANSNQYIDVYEYCCRFTLDITCESVLGIQLNSQVKNPETGEYDNAYARAMDEAMFIIYQRGTKPWLTSDYVFKLTGLYRDLQKNIHVLNSLTDSLITKAQKQHEAASPSERENRPKTMINMLISNNDANELSHHDIRHELNTMIVAGGGSTGHALSFILLMLAMFPDVQQRVYEEVQKHATDSDLTKDQLCELEYLDQVIRETLRLFPMFAMVGRVIRGDVPMKSQDITLKNKTVAILAIHVLHHNKEVWGEDAFEFNPDRFSPENSVDRHPYSFMAFSAGYRNCIGYKLAKNTLKVVLVKFLQKYRLETEEKFENIECEFKVMLKKVGGWKVKMFDR